MPHRTVRLIALTALLFALQLPSPAHAAGPNALKKLGRGVINTATGWVELPVQIIQSKRDDSAALWVATGACKGVSLAVARTLYGVWDIATFPFSPYDRPLMDPEFVLAPGRPHPKTVD